MIVIKGKYNVARVMLPDDTYLDDETRKQIYGFLNHPAFKGEPIIIMPDTHAGKGSVIGFTMKMNNYVIPNVVGVDIGCGMSAVKLPDKDIDFLKFDTFIKNNIPSGFGVHSNSKKRPLLDKYVGSSHREYYEEQSKLIEQTVSSIDSLGTLGGGNHFIEIDKSPEGAQWLVIHSGSRNFGLKTCSFYQNKAKQLMNEMFIGDAYKDLEFLPREMGGNDYMQAMRIAQMYASDNRFLMIVTIMNGFFGYDTPKKYESDVMECVHNYIDFNDKIIRKGAIRAGIGEPVIIPLNMRDGIIFGNGKGNREWNQSAPHGAGRILSRKKAKESLNLDEVKESMVDVWTTSVNASTIDEAPQAYKDSDMIIEAIKDTVDITFIAKPIYNFKAGGE